MGRLQLLVLLHFFSLCLDYILDKETLAHTSFLAAIPCRLQVRSFYLPLRYHWTLPWLSITISVNNALASPCVPFLPLWLNVDLSTAPAPHCIMEGSSWLSSSLIMQVWQLAEISLAACLPLACMLCHQKALLSLPLLHILYSSLLDKTNP